MKIAVDIDGVILAMIPKVCEIYNERFNTNYSKADVRQWEFFKKWNISEESMYKIFDEVYENSHVLSLVDKRAPLVLKKLFNKHKVDLVTARNRQFERNLIQRLDILNIKKGTHYENMIHVKAKPYETKLSLNYDIFIDDNPNLIKAIREYKNKELLLYDQPWNKNFQVNKKVSKVYNWNQIETLLI